MKQRYLVLCLLGAIALGVAAITPGSAAAQGRSGPEMTAPSHGRLDDATIKKAATVLPRIKEINKETRAAVQEASSPQQKRQIISHARDEQLSALRGAGITADQYERVLIALNSDPNVRAKFQSYLQGDRAM